MPATRDPTSNTSDVEFGACQSDVPDAHLDTRRECPVEQSGDRAPAQRGLEGKTDALVDRAIEEPRTFEPRRAIGLFLREARIAFPDSPRGLVWIEPRVAVLGPDRAAAMLLLPAPLVPART